MNIKKLLFIFPITIITLFTVINSNYAINEEQKSTAKFDVRDLVIKDEKYTNIYQTNSGTKYTVIGELKIDKIGIEYPILSDTSPELLSISLNKYWGSNPNEVGNMCIVGHNYANLTHFGKLSRLELRR